MTRTLLAFCLLFIMLGAPACADLTPAEEATPVDSDTSTKPPTTEPPGTEPPGTEPPGTEPPGTEPPHNNASKLASCGDIDLRWKQSASSYGISPHTFDISPNNGLLFRAHGIYGVDRVYYRATTGEVVMQNRVEDGGTPNHSSRDDGWHIETAADSNNKVSIYTLVTHRKLASFEFERWMENAKITPDAQHLIAAHCAEGGILRVKAFDAQSGTLLAETDFAELCAEHYGDALISAIHGKQVLIASPSNGGIHLIDALGGQVLASTKHFETESTDWHRRIVELRTDYQGQRVVSVGREGTIKLWSLPSLSPIESDLEAGMTTVFNSNFYAPHYERSPVAWSRSGDLFAQTGTNGELLIRDAHSYDLVATLMMPEFEPGELSTWEPNHPFDITFDRTGDAIAVSTPYGAAVWGCADEQLPQPTDHLKVLIEAPETASVDSPISIVATHIGPDDVHAHSLWIDGIPVGESTLGRTFEHTFTEPGRYTVAVQIDTGAATGLAETVVEVQ